MSTDVMTAEHEARQAQAAVDVAERQLAAGTKDVPFAALHKLTDKVRHANLAAAGARERAERQRSAERSAALAELGEHIETAAADPAAGLADSLADVAAACARVWQIAAAHDAQVAALRATAVDLGCQMSRAGVRESDGLIAPCPDGAVRHDRTLLMPVGATVEAVIARAVRGDVVSAQAAVTGSTQLQPFHRAAHYLLSTVHSGAAVCPFNDPLPPGIAAQLEKGDLRELDEAEIRAYLDVVTSR